MTLWTVITVNIKNLPLALRNLQTLLNAMVSFLAAQMYHLFRNVTIAIMNVATPEPTAPGSSINLPSGINIVF